MAINTAEIRAIALAARYQMTSRNINSAQDDIDDVVRAIKDMETRPGSLVTIGNIGHNQDMDNPCSVIHTSFGKIYMGIRSLYAAWVPPNSNDAPIRVAAVPRGSELSIAVEVIKFAELKAIELGQLPKHTDRTFNLTPMPK